jgi:hypothetical protein
MDTNSLMLSFVFGMVGMGMFMYGKKAERFVPLAAGVGLMVMPYFAPNLLVMGVVCCVLMAMPWLVRGA